MDGFPKMASSGNAPDSKPSRRAPALPVRPTEAENYTFKDDGKIPNNPKLPLVIYRNAVRLPIGADPSAIFEQLFQQNNWANSWRDSIYDYAHFHTHTHEVLGIARGRAMVRFGGEAGLLLDIKAGDVIILPAGVGHQRLKASKNLAVVGAYPIRTGSYDEPRNAKGNEEIRDAISKTPLPESDPVYGKTGRLLQLWKA
jgi:uncharacterized protein YjlB